MTISKLCLFLIVSCFCVPAMGASYFVSPNGDDNADGLTPETAWKSAAKVNGAQFQPGDSILFERGGEWREQLKPSSSGTADSKITFGAYGDPAKSRPTFYGSDVMEKGSFTQSSGSVYSKSVTTPVGSIWQDGEFYQSAYLATGKSNDQAVLRDYVANNPNSWAQIGNEVIVNTNGADPNTSPQQWTMQVREDVILARSVNHVTFADLRSDETAMWNMGYGFRAETTDGVTFIDCDAYRAGKHHFGVINSTNFLGENLLTSSVMPGLSNGGSSAYVSYSNATREGDTSVWRNIVAEDNGGQLAFYSHGEGLESLVVENLMAEGSGLAIGVENPSQTTLLKGGHIRDGVVGLYGDGIVIDGLQMDGASYIENRGSGNVIQNSVIRTTGGGIYNGAIVNFGEGAILRFNTIEVLDGANSNFAALTMIQSTADIYGNIALGDIGFQFFGPAVEGSYFGENVFADGTVFRISGENLDLEAWQALGYDLTSIFGDPALDANFVPGSPRYFDGSREVPGLDFYGVVRDGQITIGAVQVVPEASTLLMVGSFGLAIVALARRKRTA